MPVVCHVQPFPAATIAMISQCVSVANKGTSSTVTYVLIAQKVVVCAKIQHIAKPVLHRTIPMLESVSNALTLLMVAKFVLLLEIVVRV
jgi:hypothetical protein